MTSTKKGIVVVLIVAGLAAGSYFLFYRKKKVTKNDMVQAIVLSPKTVISNNGKTYQQNVAAYMAFGDDYILEWFNALQSGATSFTHKGAAIDISTGRAIV